MHLSRLISNFPQIFRSSLISAFFISCPMNTPSVILSSVTFGKISFKYRKQTPVSFKSFTNCFIKLNLMYREARELILNQLSSAESHFFFFLIFHLNISFSDHSFFIQDWCLAQLFHSYKKEGSLTQLALLA